MRKFSKIISIILSLVMAIVILESPLDIAQAAQTKEGVYGVEGYNIKSISKSGNKLKVTTRQSKQMSTVRGEHLVYLKDKTQTFILTKKTNYLMQYYLSGNVKKSSLSKIKKAIKISTKYKDEYEAASEDEYFDMETSDYPFLYILVDKNGKVTDIQYSEGGFDILYYEE